MNPHPLRRSACAAALLLLSGVAHASIYMDLPGADGASTALGHEKWISVGSLQWGVGVSAVLENTGRAWQVSRPSFSDIVWSQEADISVPRLMNKLFTRSITEKSTIDLTRTDSRGSETTYLQLETEKVAVTGVSLSNGSVSASQAYSKIQMSYTPSSTGKDAGSKIVASYDLVTEKGTLSGARAPLTSGGGTSVAPGIYMRLGSGNDAIAGEVTGEAYRNWIQIDSAQLGVGASYSPATRSVSAPSFSELSITQAFDQTTPVVFNRLVTGKSVGEVVVDYVSVYGRGRDPVAYMRLVFQDVVFTGLSLSSGGDQPYVSESMSFSRMSQTVWELDENGKATGSSSYGYDLRAQKALDDALQGASVSNFGNGRLAAMAAGSEAPPPAPAPIPEPRTALMLLAGLGVLAIAAKRRLPT